MSNHYFQSLPKTPQKNLRMPTLITKCMLLLLALCLYATQVNSLQFSTVVRKCHACAVGAAIFTSSQFIQLPHDHMSYANAAVDISSAANMERVADGLTTQKLENGLSQPTDERPQIKPPTQLQAPVTQTAKSKARSPIVEGMVYMMEKYERPDPSDMIVLTVTSRSQPDEILAGAKYPVYRARLPFNFQLYEANILKGKYDSFQNSADGDLMVVATVCPQEAASFPCSKKESLYEAKSISKMLQIPGMQEGDLVRTPAALPLTQTPSL